MSGTHLRPGHQLPLWLARHFHPPARLPGTHRRSCYNQPCYKWRDLMKPMNWAGVIPAITTPFNEDLSVDHAFLAKHCGWLIDNGCTGVVALGSLGEGAT